MKNHLNKDSITEFQLLRDGEAKSRDSPRHESQSREMRNPKNLKKSASLGVLDTGISVTGRWK
jgi:hypothetical protein